jgi:hypothetical protein
MPNDTPTMNPEDLARQAGAENKQEVQQPETPAAELDVDAAALAEAQKGLDGEKTGETKTPEAKPEDAKPVAEQKPEGTTKPEDERAKPILIPKGRFDEVLRERDKLIATAAYHKARADAAEAAKPGKAEEAKAPTPEEQIKTLRTQRLELAEKVDAGELTYKQAEQQRQQLEDAEQAVRDTVRKPAEQPRAQPKADSGLYLEEKTKDIEKDHPYLAEIKDEGDFQFLVVKAVGELAKQGVRLPQGNLTEAQQLQLREKVAELSDEFGPVLTGKKLEIPGKKSGGESGPSKEAQAREAKLAVAESMPPDLTSTRSANPAGTVDAASIVSMNEEDIAKLPKSVRESISKGSW